MHVCTLVCKGSQLLAGADAHEPKVFVTPWAALVEGRMSNHAGEIVAPVEGFVSYNLDGWAYLLTRYQHYQPPDIRICMIALYSLCQVV